MDRGIGRMSIRNKQHPEWGTFGISERYNDDPAIWNIRGDRGSRTLGEGELRYWEQA
jgi:hypothetical protein